jgi:hypothetical protein
MNHSGGSPSKFCLGLAHEHTKYTARDNLPANWGPVRWGITYSACTPGRDCNAAVTVRYAHKDNTALQTMSAQIKQARMTGGCGAGRQTIKQYDLLHDAQAGREHPYTRSIFIPLHAVTPGQAGSNCNAMSQGVPTSHDSRNKHDLSGTPGPSAVQAMYRSRPHHLKS